VENVILRINNYLSQAMKNFLFLLGLIFLFDIPKSFSQSDLEHKAPTLQIGLDGLSLTKGALDYEIIMQMVSEKQSEVKLKFIQNLFLKKIDSAGGLTYSYVDNILKAILLEKDQKIRTKMVLENTVNMVFVAAYTEYFMRLNKDNSAVQALLNKFTEGKKIKYDLDLQKPILSSLLINTINERVILGKKDNSNSKLSNDLRIKRDFIALLIDMGSECVRQDQNLKRLGLMQVSYSAGYEYKNKYLEEINDLDDKDRQNAAKLLYKEMSASLAKVTNVIGLINYITSESSFRNSDLNLLKKQDSTSISSNNNKVFGFSDLSKTLSSVDTKLSLVIKKLTEEVFYEDTILRKQVGDIIKVKNYILKAQNFIKIADSSAITKFKNAAVFSDVLYSISKEFVPALENIAYKHAEVLQSTEELKSFSAILATRIVKNLSLTELNNEKAQQFLLLVSKLYQFDRASTFSDYLNYVNDLVDLFPNQRVKSVFSNVNTFVKDYTVITLNEKGKEVIEFNIESYLAKLSNIKKEKFNPIEFHFTVGLNSGYFKTPLTYKNETFDSFSSVSEKIGLKIKFFDFKFTNLRDPGETYSILGTKWVRNSAPKDPLISNIHLLLYGSGVLYSILNTSTNKTFNAPLVGAGVGITFINSLDANLSFAVPILNDRSLKSAFQTRLFNLGFDVQIGEYLSRIGKKKSTKIKN
jgi:hypothetical protein